MATVITQGSRRALAFEQITVDATAGGKSLTAATFTKIKPTQTVGYGVPPVVVNAKSCFITVEGTAGTNDIRVTFDGTAPTSTVGHLVVAGSTITIDGTDNMLAFRAIRVGGTSGAISVTYYDS